MVIATPKSEYNPMEDIKDVDTTTQKEEEIDEKEFFETEPTEDVETLKEQLAKTTAANKRLFARLQKEKEEKANIKTNQDTTTGITKDEVVLIAQGMKLEHLDHLKLIQKGMGGTLKEAYDSPLFQSLVAQEKAEEKRIKAQLPASEGGSGKLAEEFKPGMTEAEHRELWKKHQG